MSLAERRWLRISTLCVLYVAQGIPWGFMATTLPAYLISRGLDFKSVSTLLAFTTLPYAFKWVWGPIIDTVSIPRFGRRRPWIILAQGLMAATILAMVALDVKTEVKLLGWMVCLHTVFNALQDVAVDALAVDILPENERGSANGLMYGSKYIGGALGGVGMTKVITWAGLDTALVVQACVLFAIMLVPLLVKERSGPPPKREPVRELARALRQAFSLRSTVVAALLMVGANFALGLLNACGNDLFIRELKWSAEDYTEITGGYALVIGGLSAAAAGALSDKIGRRRLASIAAIGLAVNWFVFAVQRSWWTNDVYIYSTAVIENVFTPMFTVSLIAMCMDLSWPKIAGTQFTAYMALSNVSTTLGYQFAGMVNGKWSFPGIWKFAAVWQVAILLPLLAIDPQQTRRELPFPEGKPVPRLGIVVLAALLACLLYFTWQKLK